ncbi:MAG: TIGR03790 family protein, partial [Limisphaerales bacterium]
MGARTTFLVLLSILLARAAAAMAETGDAVVVVYNSSVPASKQVAEHYAAKRAVPPEQILSFALPELETISRDDFEKKLQQPLWNELRARKLLTYGEGHTVHLSTQICNVVSAKIRYVVLCYGVPVKIAPDTTRKEPQFEKAQAELRRNEAAVESELIFLPMLDQKFPIAGPLMNALHNATNRALLHPTNGVLMVTRVDGPTPEIAMGLVDKAMQAEKDGLWGNVYVDMRGITEPGMKQADDMFKATGELARLFGYDVVNETSGRTFSPGTPLSDIAFYFGWYDQSVSGPFTNGMAEFRPGAIAYHLHSFSARDLRTPNVWWAGPLLAAGATATMGCTEEPYLQSTPHMNSLFYRFVHLGFSFGEAALASQPWLSWQITVIGDPLYRPFVKNQKQRFEELLASRHKNLEWSILMWVNFMQARSAPLE